MRHIHPCRLFYVLTQRGFLCLVILMEERGELIYVMPFTLKLFSKQWLLHINIQVITIIIASCIMPISKVIVKITDTVTSLIILVSDAIKWQDVMFLNDTYHRLSSLLRCSCGRRYSSSAVVLIELLKILLLTALNRFCNSIHISWKTLPSSPTSNLLNWF